MNERMGSELDSAFRVKDRRGKRPGPKCGRAQNLLFPGCCPNDALVFLNVNPGGCHDISPSCNAPEGSRKHSHSLYHMQPLELGAPVIPLPSGASPDSQSVNTILGPGDGGVS